MYFQSSHILKHHKSLLISIVFMNNLSLDSLTYSFDLLNFQIFIWNYYTSAWKKKERKWSRSVMPDSLQPYGLSGSSVHGIFQARVLEWVTICFSRGSSQPRDRTRVSCIVGRCFYHLSHQGSHSNILNISVHSDLLVLTTHFFLSENIIILPTFLEYILFGIKLM